MIKKDYGVVKIKEEDIFFDGMDLKEISKKYESPFFLMSQKQLENNYNNFLEAFSGIEKFSVFFSVKTNFESEVLKTLKKIGASAEISGSQDLFVSKKAGFLADQIVFDGPCKKEKELAEVIEMGIHCINAESIEELRQIEKVAAEKNKKVNIGIRIDPLVDSHYYDAIIDTYKRKFGYPIDEVKDVFLNVKRLPHLNPIAIHAHIGSQLFDISMYTRTIDKLFKLIYDLGENDIKIREINIGGGFPAQSMRSVKISRRLVVAQVMEKIGLNIEKKVPSIFDFGKEISEAYHRNINRYGIRPAVIAEPGRCIVSNVGILVGKVISQKRNWVFTDISVNDLAENIFFSERDFAICGKMNQSLGTPVNISGPTLSTADVLYLKERIPEVNKDDTIAIFDVGAYSIARSTQFTQPRKAVYFIMKDKKIKLIRSRETCEDVMKNQIW